MKKSTLLLLSLLPLAPTAFANDNPHAIGDPVISIVFGLTVGGDELAELEYDDGSNNDITAGGFGLVGAGLNFKLQDKFSLQLNAAYHWEVASAKNGDLTFSRIELEIVPYYQLNKSFRLGLGIAQHMNPELDSDSSSNVKYDHSNGFVLSLVYQLPDSKSWIDFRYVNIEYKPNKIGNLSLDDYDVKTFDGSSVGVSFNWAF
ncbi:MAG: hypothetical protein HRU25_15305 [Psychrobium sp.]|nr:hypothetical protein [Psychrobium sp.]